jgi:uncharacterized protein (TIGR00730 family)
MKAKSLCVYCGAAAGVRPAYAAAAHRLGQLMAERGIKLIYGGGQIGLMGVLADGVLKAGGDAIGVLPDFLRRVERPHEGLHELRIVDSMHVRKQVMAELADAFAILPGGLGTLDEAFEIITWRQLGLHDKPVILVDVDGYWDPLLRLIDQVAAEGFARGPHGLLQVVPDVDALIAALERAPEPVLPESVRRM